MTEIITKTIEIEKPTKSEIEPYLKDIYEAYCLWKSLPALFKYPPMDKDGVRPNPRDFAEQMGVDDEQLLDLVTIKNQTEFSLRFQVHKDTLTNWNNTLKTRDALADLRAWAKHLSKNVLVSLYNTCVRRGWAIDAKLWFQLVNGFEERGKPTGEMMGDIHFNIILNKPNENNTRVINQADGNVGASA